MDRLSASDAARALCTTVPRVQRAIDRLGMQRSRGGGGRVTLTPAQFGRLRDELGVTPRIPGFSPVEVRVLAALARAPMGLASARVVAKRAGVSPTAASRALRSLGDRGLLRRERTTVAAGRAVEVELLHANVTAPEWHKLAPTLARVVPPRPLRRRDRRVPPYLRHLFWNSDPSQLELPANGGYIARRLLTSGDVEGIAWGIANLAPTDWRHAAEARGLDPESRSLALNIADSGGK